MPEPPVLGILPRIDCSRPVQCLTGLSTSITVAGRHSRLLVAIIMQYLNDRRAAMVVLN